MKNLFYLKQAKFISTRITQTIDHILTNSKIPPIILLFSDHGKFPVGCTAKGKKTLPLQEIAWRFSNLQALYLPDFPDKLSEQITPVNTIRKVLNHYFGYDFPVLEDLCHPHFTDLSQHVSNQTILDYLTSWNGEPLNTSK
ncbi:MAG: hypothetical protein ACHQUC_10045 [Chlamydiales bacterium]